MAVHVETLDKLERRITLTLPAATIQSEVESRLQEAVAHRRADGFRPGKVPMSVVAQRYGYSVHYEVMNDKVGAGLRRRPPTRPSCAWPASPRITEKEGAPEGERGLRRDLRGLPRGQDRRPGRRRGRARQRPRSTTKRSTRRSTSCASSAAPSPSARPPSRRAGRRPRDDRLRRQDRRRAVRGRQGRGLPVHHRRRPDARAVRRGRARHEGRATSKTFPLQFPADYHGKDVAGKEADFMVTMKKIEAPAPAGGRRGVRQVAGHRRRHGRGAARRHAQEPRARSQVPPAGAQQGRRDGRAGASAELDVPKSLRRRRDRAHGRGDARRPEAARHQGRRQGADSRPRCSSAQAERRVRLGLVVGRAGAQPATCRPSPSSSRRTSRSCRRATRSRPR